MGHSAARLADSESSQLTTHCIECNLTDFNSFPFSSEVFCVRDRESISRSEHKCALPPTSRSRCRPKLTLLPSGRRPGLYVSTIDPDRHHWPQEVCISAQRRGRLRTAGES